MFLIKDFVIQEYNVLIDLLGVQIVTISIIFLNSELHREFYTDDLHCNYTVFHE